MEEMAGLLLKSGKFDELAIAHVRNIENGVYSSINDAIPDRPVVKFIDIDSVASQSTKREILEARHTAEDQARDMSVAECRRPLHPTKKSRW